MNIVPISVVGMETCFIVSHAGLKTATLVDLQQ
jgi:hypothetical protein